MCLDGFRWIARLARAWMFFDMGFNIASRRDGVLGNWLLSPRAPLRVWDVNLARSSEYRGRAGIVLLHVSTLGDLFQGLREHLVAQVQHVITMRTFMGKGRGSLIDGVYELSIKFIDQSLTRVVIELAEFLINHASFFQGHEYRVFIRAAIPAS